MVIADLDVRRALQQGEFEPYFQPLMVLRTGRLAGFEVLARWRHPTAGLLLPDRFIPLAESDGWIGDLTQEILRQSFSTLQSLSTSLTIAINISPLQLRDLSLPSQIRSVADQTDFLLERLVVEITETALTDNLEHALIIAKELKSMGCRLALDDFGTGYSSLLHLQSLPFDELKVDRSFVGSMTQRRESRKIVGAVIGLGQNLGLTTVAEGIETEEQAELLRWLGCDLAQGWLFGRPMPAEEAIRFVSESRQPIPSDTSTPLSATSLDNLNGSPAQRLAQLQAVYDGAPVGLAFLDTNLRYVNLNQRLADMNGLPVEEHLGRTIAEIMPDSAYHQFEPWMRRALAGESVSDLEVTKALPANRQFKTVLASYQPVRDEAHEVIGISVALVDITERKYMEEALRESEDHYRHMVELNPQIPWIMDAEWRNVEVSPKWESLTGLSRAQSHGDGWLSVLHPDDREHTIAAMEARMNNPEPVDVEYRVRRPEGGWRWMRARGSARLDSDGRILGWYGGVEDVDHQKRIGEELRMSEARLQAVFESAPVGIVLADAPDGTVRMANREARKLLQDPSLLGRNINSYSQWSAERANGELLTLDEYPLVRALRGEKTQPEELLVRFVDSAGRWLALAGAPIFGSDGTVVGAVLVAQDIDSDKRERQDLLDLVDKLSHELHPKS